MNKFNLSLLLLLFVKLLFAQQVTTVTTDTDISKNLDLKAIASLFGESKDLEDFERQLNNPDKHISNLDLNEDNEVDYLRVIEETEDDTHLIIIQAVLGKELYQDVATIEVEKSKNGKKVIQVVGDVYIYGPNYIIEPVYVTPPVIFSIFWRPFYRPYRSVYYWGYFPAYYHPWRPVATRVYRRNIQVHINIHHHYRRVKIRRSRRAAGIYTKYRRNDFGRKHPGKSYTVRNNKYRKQKYSQRQKNSKIKLLKSKQQTGHRKITKKKRKNYKIHNKKREQNTGKFTNKSKKRKNHIKNRRLNKRH
jgi:hypothetical protein